MPDSEGDCPLETPKFAVYIMDLGSSLVRETPITLTSGFYGCKFYDF